VRLFDNLSSQQVMELANKVGHKIAREYPGIDADDIASEALSRLATKAPKLDNPSAGYVYRVLERDAGAYAAKVRYERVISTSQYVYTPREIRALLAEVYYDPTCWDVPQAKDDRLSAEINGRTIGIALMDIKAALERIKPEYAQTIENRYGHGDETIHRQKVARAVDSLTMAVNRIAAKTGRADNRPGARTAMSNGRAQYVTRAETGHETNRHEVDAVNKLHQERRDQGSAPPGTYFDWNKGCV
jgi:hypothetical protein